MKTIGIRKRRFDRSTVIIKQSEDKNLHKYTNYIVEQRTDKCKKHENVKKGGTKNNKNIQE